MLVIIISILHEVTVELIKWMISHQVINLSLQLPNFQSSHCRAVYSVISIFLFPGQILVLLNRLHCFLTAVSGAAGTTHYVSVDVVEATNVTLASKVNRNVCILKTTRPKHISKQTVALKYCRCINAPSLTATGFRSFQRGMKKTYRDLTLCSDRSAQPLHHSNLQ